MWWFTKLSEIGRSRYFVQPLGLRFILAYDENRIFLTFFKPIVFGNLPFYGEKKYLVKWNAHAIRWLPCHYWSKSAVVGVSLGLWTGDNSVHCRRDWVKLVLVGMWWFTNLSEIGRSRYFVQPLGLRFILAYDENRIFLTFFKPIVFGNLPFYGEKKYMVKWNAHAIRWLPCHYWSKSAVVGVSLGLWTGDNSVHCRRDWVKLVLVGMWWFTNLSEIGRSRYFVQPLGLRFILAYDENRIFLTFLKPIVFGNLRFYGKKNIW